MMQKQESILIDFEFVCELVIIVIVEWWIQKYKNMAIIMLEVLVC